MAKRKQGKRVKANQDKKAVAKPDPKQKAKQKPDPPTRKRGRPAGDVTDWAPAFLAAIIEGLHVRDACTSAGVSGGTPYQRRQADEVFRVAWQDASDIGTEALEQEAARRAYHGTLRPVFHKGEECGLVREYSDQLMIFLLRARDPAKYRDTQKHEHSGPGGKGIPVEIVGIEVVPPSAPAPAKP